MDEKKNERPTNKNLVAPFTKENAAYYGSRGGKASAAAKRRKKNISELAIAMLDSNMSKRDAEKLAKLFDGITAEDVTIAAAILSKQIQAALRGDIRAASFVVELVGKTNATAEAQSDELSDALEGLADEMMRDDQR